MVPCWVLWIRCRIIIGIPKRDHNFDNHLYGLYLVPEVGIWGPLWALSIYQVLLDLAVAAATTLFMGHVSAIFLGPGLGFGS